MTIAYAAHCYGNHLLKILFSHKIREVVSAKFLQSMHRGSTVFDISG